jgi:transposase InsO family protein
MHRRPRLSAYGRLLVVERLMSGRSATVVAEELGVSRATVYKWWRRFQVEGEDGLRDRSCRPLRSPSQLSPEAESAILALRRTEKLGPHRLASRLGHPRSTCYKVLQRHGLHRLDWMDRPTGRVVRRYEWEHPGELVHVDIKKLGRIPPGGGHRVLGRRQGVDRHRALGYDFVHSLVDDHSRLAYSEVLPDEKATSCADFLRRAGAFLAQFDIQIQRVMTDNGAAYRHGREFRAAVAGLGARQIFTPFYKPQVNGKVERFNRTLLAEWAYVRPYADNAERLGLLTDWLHRYNFHRGHTAMAGRPPIERVNNLRGNYS